MNDGANPPPPVTDPESARKGKPKGFFARFRAARNAENAVRKTLEELIEDRVEVQDPINADERALLANIFRLRDRTVADVMVPRADIVAVAADTSLAELTELMTREGHSRIPVFADTLDDASGMVHIKDVLAVGDGVVANLAVIQRPVIFVSPSMQVLELLLEMRVKRTHMALVVDEFGGIDGLATIEDLVEEIVGEIEDEHDRETGPDLIRRDDGSIDADARASIEDFEKMVGPVLSPEEREEVDTLGGLVVTLAGRVPIRGELIGHPSGMEIEILEADPRRLRQLRVRGLKSNPPDSDESERN